MEWLWARHSLGRASVSPSALWEPSLDGLKAPSGSGMPGSYKAVGLQRGAEGRVGGWQARGQPHREGSHDLWAAFPAQLRMPLTSGSSKHSKEACVWGFPTEKRPGQQPEVQVPTQQTYVLLPEHPHTGSARGPREVTRVKPPLGVWQGHTGVCLQGLFPNLGKGLDREP